MMSPEGWIATIGIPLLILAARQCWKFQSSMQDHIEKLHEQIENMNGRLLICESDRAVLRQRVEVLENAGRIEDSGRHEPGPA